MFYQSVEKETHTMKYPLKKKPPSHTELRNVYLQETSKSKLQSN